MNEYTYTYTYPRRYPAQEIFLRKLSAFHHLGAPIQQDHSKFPSQGCSWVAENTVAVRWSLVMSDPGRAESVSN